MSHLPVLLAEALEGLAIQPDGRYVDGTFGRGGHSAAILQRLGPQGQLLALDRDPQAIAAGQALAANDPRLTLRHAAFDTLREHLTDLGWSGEIQGMLFDLGLSSPQVDEAERGFSFVQDGPLDMRMDPTQGEPLWAWLENLEEKELADVIYRYGEERWSRRIARAIKHRESPIRTTRELADLVARAQPRTDPHKHPATRTFQALRIALNQEIQQLENLLAQSVDLLAPGGRIAVISFHSGEDRVVKQFFRQQAQGDPYPPDLPVPAHAIHHPLRLVGKAIKPGSVEIQANPRARSAVLRMAEKT